MWCYLVFVALFRTAFAFGSIPSTIDDMDSNFQDQSVQMEETGLDHCRTDAYSDGFHHDAGVNKGSASMEFRFDVEESGCYSFEEYHPGSTGNSDCSNLLTTNAQLEIDWCVGQSSTIIIDQSTKGGLWNFVGIFPFFVGHQGAIRMSNPGGAAGRHLTVDAFRITRVADTCTAALQQQLFAEWQQANAVATASVAEAPNAVATASVAEALAGHDSLAMTGSLQLSVRSNPGAGEIDLLAGLKAEAATLATTLKNYLRAGQVVVKSILPVDARRLGGCRRLESATNTFDFEVVFMTDIAAVVAMVEAGFVAELNRDLSVAGAKFQVESAELRWQAVDATAHDDPDETASDLPLLLISVGVTFVFTVAVAAMLIAMKRRKPSPDTVNMPQKELEEGENHDPSICEA